ncbi:hypothetical protein Tco_1128595 [Tanacetum coccineum]
MSDLDVAGYNICTGKITAKIANIVEALVQRLINEDKGRQDVLLNLAFQFEDSCAVRDDLRKAYEKCNDISQENRALICTLLKESSKKDRKLHLSMYGKAAQLERQMETKSAWFQEKYSGRTPGGIGCSSSQTDFPLTEKELHQLRMDEEALKEMLEEEAMNKKAQEEKIRQEQAENDAFFLEFGVVRSSSLAVTSSGLSFDVLDAGLPSEKVMSSGKNNDDGDLLLFRDDPGACDISARTLRLFISWECSRPVAGVKVSPSSGVLDLSIGVPSSPSYYEFVVHVSR